MTIALGDLAGEHGAGSAVGVVDHGLQPHRCAAVKRHLRFGDQLAVEDILDLVVLLLAMEDRRILLRHRLGEQLGEVEALGLPVLDELALVEHLHLPDHVVEAAIAELGHYLAHFLGDEEEIVDDVLGLALEALAQHRVLRRDADRAGV